jgi:hypothetical protein
MTQRNPMLKSPRIKNEELRLVYITTNTMQRNNNHQRKDLAINKLIMDQNGTRNETNRKVH